MGRVSERMQRQAQEKFEQEKDKTDKRQVMSEDGYSFFIERENGVILIWDGTIGEWRTINTFSQKFIEGYAKFDENDDFVERWHTQDIKGSLQEYLGFTEEEYTMYLRGELKELEEKLVAKRH